MGLDHSAQQILDAVAKAQAQGVPQLHEVSPAQAREMHLRSKAVFGTDGPALSEVCELQMPGPSGSIPARLYRDGTDRVPVVIYYHGGGWVVGDLDSHDGLCRHIAKQSGFAVLSVDYRLAPEHPFPAAVDDAYAALEWVAAAGQSLGIDATRIAVAGDSAGGNLSAVVPQLAKERNGPTIGLQALLYPATDMHADSESHLLFTEHLLTPDSYRWFIEHYLTNAADRDDPRASPLRATDLSGLPPAFVLTAGFDPLRDEGRAYAEQLDHAGVEVTYRCFEGQIHGFLTLDKVVNEAATAIAELVAALKRALS